jgi:drug/metabolite transporter (DMT)-like permease
MWALASATAYSLSSVVGKDLLDSLGPTSLLAWRFSVAAAVLFGALAIWRRHGGPDPMDVPRRTGLLLGAMFGLSVLVGFYSLDRLDASVYIVVVYTYPAFVVIGSALLGLRTGWGVWAALTLVMIGVVLTVPELFERGGDISGTGVALGVAQAIMIGAYMVTSGRLLPDGTDGVVVSAWVSVGSALVTVPIALIDGLVLPRGATLVFEVGMFALIPTVMSTVTFFLALRYLAPGVAAMVLTVEVVLVIAWSVIFLGEDVRPIQIIGAAVVVGGVLLAQRVRASPPAV